MNYRPLIVDHVEGAGLISLNRPDALNAIHATPGQKEGMRAFVEKRAAKF